MFKEHIGIYQSLEEIHINAKNASKKAMVEKRIVTCSTDCLHTAEASVSTSMAEEGIVKIDIAFKTFYFTPDEARAFIRNIEWGMDKAETNKLSLPREALEEVQGNIYDDVADAVRSIINAPIHG